MIDELFATSDLLRDCAGDGSLSDDSDERDASFLAGVLHTYAALLRMGIELPEDLLMERIEAANTILSGGHDVE